MDAKLALLSTLGASAGGAGAFGIYKFASKEEAVKPFTDEEYQLIFKEFKSDNSFIEALKTKKSSITNTSSKEDGGWASKEWCFGNNSEEARKWCVKLPTTVGSKIGKSLSSDWAKRIQAIKDKSNVALLTDLKTIKDTLSKVEDNQDSRDALEGWCKSKWDTKVINDSDNSIYTKVKERCVDSE